MKDVDTAKVAASPPDLTRRLEIDFPEQDWLSATELKAITSPEVLVERVRALTPLIAANAGACEMGRRPVLEVWNALRKSGIFYHFVPKRYGGLEFSHESFIDTMMPIGGACASTCWATVFGVNHNWFLAHFPQKAQDEFFGDGRYTVAPGTGVFVKPSPARRVQGGYRLSGRFRFGSAVMNSDWTLLQTWVDGEDVGSTLSWMAIPSQEVQVLDTWHMNGMAGTGSNDIQVEDVFIPEYRTVRWHDMLEGTSPGLEFNTNPIYRVAPFQLSAINIAIPMIGASRGVVDLYTQHMAARRRPASMVTQSTKAAIQVRAARADLLMDSAELGMRDIVRFISAVAERGELLSEHDRLKMTAKCAHATDMAHDAVTLVERSGGSNIYASSNAMQRLIRDIQVAKSHHLLEFDEMGENYGRALFGLERVTPLY